MTAKLMFENLGFIQYENSDEGIGYIKKAPQEEMTRIGIISSDYIEFYKKSREVLINTTYEFRNGTVKNSDCGIISAAILAAINQQSEELGWNK